MRNTIIALSVVATLVAFSSVAFSQDPHDPHWKTCPQCRSAKDKAAERAKAANLPFDPKDLSGNWGDNQNRIQLSRDIPPFTPLGKQMFDATETDKTPDGKPISNSKDPMLHCDPLGFPRYFTYNYGYEFLPLKDRTLQFFEMWHTWRTIWTDGRPLPEHPDPRWLGYSVGHWEGNTFVVESYGFDERTWLSENYQGKRDHGWPHSDQLRTVERYTRTDHNTLDVSLTITDPKVYTKPWVTTGKFLLNPDTELWEDFCVPSDAEYFNSTSLRPAAGQLEK
jgi:hypothetical protein